MFRDLRIMSLMAQNFNKLLKRVEKGQNKTMNIFQRTKRNKQGYKNYKTGNDRSGKLKDLQCHECEGFGNFKNECPLVKRRVLKCTKCKGFGHMKAECPSFQSKGERSLMCFNDT